MKRVKKIMRRKVTHRKLIIVCLGADTSSEIEFAKVFFCLYWRIECDSAVLPEFQVHFPTGDWVV